jgi:hypothetical protein
MDWAVVHLGSLGRWLVENPFAFVTLGLIAALLFLAISVIHTEFNPPSSIIVDVNRRPYVSQPKTAEIALMVFVIVVLTLAVIYGTVKYYAIVKAPVSPVVVAKSAAPVNPPPPTQPSEKKSEPRTGRKLLNTAPAISPQPKSTEDSGQQPVEVQFSCEPAMLPVTIPAHSTAYVLALNETLNKHPHALQGQAIVARDAPELYPSWNVVDTMMTSQDRLSIRCDVTNLSGFDLRDVLVLIKTKYDVIKHQQNPFYDSQVMIGFLAKKQTVPIYLVNGCPTEISMQFPDSGRALLFGESQAREFNFIYPDRSTHGYQMSGASKAWTGQGCD